MPRALDTTMRPLRADVFNKYVYMKKWENVELMKGDLLNANIYNILWLQQQ